MKNHKVQFGIEKVKFISFSLNFSFLLQNIVFLAPL
jgi:hypothetical protein